MLSCVWLFAAPWTIAYQSPRSVEFSRHEYWSVLSLPTPGDLPDPGIEPKSPGPPALAGWFFTTSATWEAPLVDIWLKDKQAGILLWLESLNWCSLCLSFQPHLFLPALCWVCGSPDSPFLFYGTCQVFLDSGPLYVSSCCPCLGFSHLSSFGDSFSFFFYLGFSSSSPISETPSAASSSQISSLLWFSVLAAPPFCVGSFFRGVILGWNVNIWWAGTFLLSVASSAPSAEPGFQRYTSHVSKSINQSWISSDVKELTVECWVVGHLKIVITVSYFKSYCQLKNEKNSMTGFKDF